MSDMKEDLSFERIYMLPQSFLKRLLSLNNLKSTNHLSDTLLAIKLFARGGRISKDLKYVKHPKFNILWISSLEKLSSLCSKYNISLRNINRIDAIRKIIDAFEKLLPKTVSCKVKYLRKRGYDNLREWLKNPNHILVTRNGRIFITNKDKPLNDPQRKEIFHYPKSIWCNPYTLKKYSLEKSLELYKKHIRKLLQNQQNLIKFNELLKVDEIACFCDEDSPCHRNIIIEMLKEFLL